MCLTEDQQPGCLTVRCSPKKFCEIKDKPVEECPVWQAWRWGKGAQQSFVTGLEVALPLEGRNAVLSEVN